MLKERVNRSDVPTNHASPLERTHRKASPDGARIGIPTNHASPSERTHRKASPDGARIADALPRDDGGHQEAEGDDEDPQDHLDEPQEKNGLQPGALDPQVGKAVRGVASQGVAGVASRGHDVAPGKGGKTGPEKSQRDRFSSGEEEDPADPPL
uniref:Uncharacterized protein n=1 Tax=Sphaerodactylus townsendi TaxID=933632 RepID=A0ACB8G877_9SAUR